MKTLAIPICFKATVVNLTHVIVTYGSTFSKIQEPFLLDQRSEMMNISLIDISKTEQVKTRTLIKHSSKQRFAHFNNIRDYSDRGL